MIDSKRLLADCVSLVKDLVEDLRTVCDDDTEANEALESEWNDARAAGRTAVAFGEWREDRLTQVAVAWVLSCVFVRFCEDNDLIDVALSGPGERLQRAKDRYTSYVTTNPSEDQQAYLADVFTSMRSLSATERLYGNHNLVWSLAPSAVGCKELLEFWWQLDEDTGELANDFTDPELDTRFLGDLYQDISADVREKYALLQTPEFVESFILDRTLDPAIDEFGLTNTDLIDPACGSGHFLLGAFERLFDQSKRQDPTANPIGLAEKALSQVAGVDLNPYAVAIARFRLLVAALKRCGIARLAEARDFGLNVAVGDSLLHGRGVQQAFDSEGLESPSAHLYTTEDEALVEAILSKTYAAVVANPPYIQGKDKAARAAYKERYPACHGKWAMSVPFFQRIFALSHRKTNERAAGFVGQITANSFMKREFGKKLVEQFLPTWDLTAMIDTSGAYLPGHGTPTIIVFGRNQNPTTDNVRAVFGLRGEPSTPAVPAEGLVWSAIEAQADSPDSTSEYVRSIDWPRSRVQTHPMVFGGGADLWFRVNGAADGRLRQRCVVGIFGITAADSSFLASEDSFQRRHVPGNWIRRIVAGEELRDWGLTDGDSAIFPYSVEGDLMSLEHFVKSWLWPCRTVLGERRTFNKTSYFEDGRAWWEWHQVSLGRLHPPLSIAYGEIATHNHFVLDRGGKVFNRTAPILKMPAGAREADHFELLGPLNSSLGCFWLKQVCYPKGGDSVGQEGARIRKLLWEERYAHAGTPLKEFPLCSHALSPYANRLDQLARDAKGAVGVISDAPTSTAIPKAEATLADIRAKLVGTQESLDWRAMFDYGLIDEDLSEPADSSTPLARGERAFEIVLARRAEAGLDTRAWFERHKSTPITEPPANWSPEYRDLVERRIAAIEADPAGVGFIERPEFKRRWNWESWDDIEQRVLRSWLVDAIEGLDVWRAGSVTSAARVSDLAQAEVEGFAEVAVLFAGPDVSVLRVVGDLLAEEAVAHVAGLRLKPAGMRKRTTWEQTWELQRAEDAIDARAGLDPGDSSHLSEEAAAELKAEQVGSIPKPSDYVADDMYQSAWKHRGKLDVPKERFIAYPGGAAADGDTSAVFGWAGWDHSQQGRALAQLYVQRKREAAEPAVLEELLAGVWELVPWVKQWHNDGPRPEGDQLAAFVQREASSLGLTVDDLTGWIPNR